MVELLRRDREWRDYPIGTKAHAYNGGAWLRTERGWTWNGHTRSPGSTFPTPGADAFGKCIELPAGGVLASRRQTPGSAPATYTTRPAESLCGIALRQLGDEHRWTEIRDMNADMYPGMLGADYYPPGTVLNMPPRLVANRRTK